MQHLALPLCPPSSSNQTLTISLALVPALLFWNKGGPSSVLCHFKSESKFSLFLSFLLGPNIATVKAEENGPIGRPTATPPPNSAQHPPLKPFSTTMRVCAPGGQA